jgi:pimeloyl-ACP methyl ester carboxylesterase
MKTSTMSFPVGYHQIHPDVSVNFQLNRWATWVGADAPAMVAEMREMLAGEVTYPELVRGLTSLAERSERAGRTFTAAYYLRAASFFLGIRDPEYVDLRNRFLRIVRAHHGLSERDVIAVPYEGKTLPAYRLFASPSASRTLLIHGGFDSFIEEWLPMLAYIRDAGYDVVAFDGPGQGGALVDSGIPMTHRWERPVGAVLDYFALAKVDLIGFSLGGCLAIRAAAFEPRIASVVAYDALTEYSDVVLRDLSPAARSLVRVLLAFRADGMLDRIIRRRMQHSMVAGWGIPYGMSVFGVATPSEFLRGSVAYTTRDVSERVEQDVLVMAGSADHYVPRLQFEEQTNLLRNARSVTARLFTTSESAQNHCQIGNIGLAVDVILDWLALTRRKRNQQPQSIVDLNSSMGLK